MSLSALLPWAGLGPAWASEVQIGRPAAGQAREVQTTLAALPRLDLSLSRWAERVLPAERAEINQAVSGLRESLVHFPDYPDAARRRLGELREKAMSGVPAARAAVALLSHDAAALESRRELLSQRLTPGGFLRLKSAAKLLRGNENLKTELQLFLAAAQLQEAYDHASPRERPAHLLPEAMPEPAVETAAGAQAQAVPEIQVQASPETPAEAPAPASEAAQTPRKQVFADSSPIHTILFTPGGRYRIEGRRRSVLIREAASLKPLRRLETGPLKKIVLDGGRLFTVGTYAGTEEPQGEAHALKVWDLQQGIELGRFPGTLPIEAFLVEPGGRRAWVVDYHQTLWSWDPRAGDARERLTLADKRYHALALGLQQGKVRVLARRLRDESRSLRTLHSEREVKRGSRTYLVESRREIELIESEADFAVYLLTLKGKRLRRFSGHEGKVNAAALSPDGRSLYTASDDKTARQWSLESGQETLRFSGHEDAVLDVLANPSGRRLFTSGADGTIKVWDATSGRALATLRGHAQGVSSLALGPDEQHLYSAGRDGESLMDWAGLAALRAASAAQPPVPQLETSPKADERASQLASARAESPAEEQTASRLASARAPIWWEVQTLKIGLQDDWKISGFLGAVSALLLMINPIFGAILGTAALGFLTHSMHKLGRRHAAEAYLSAEDEAGLADAPLLRRVWPFDDYLPLIVGGGVMATAAILVLRLLEWISLPLSVATGVFLLSLLVLMLSMAAGAVHDAGVAAFEHKNRAALESLAAAVKATTPARRDAVIGARD